MKLHLPALQAEGPLYQAVAGQLDRLMDEGTLRAGDRLPSIRELAREWNVSLTTVMEAYRLLESRGAIEARPQSGHYVRPRFEHALAEPEPRLAPQRPSPVSISEWARQVLADTNNPNLLQLGAALPNPKYLPWEKLNRMMSAAARRSGERSMGYEFVPGSKALRTQIARRCLAMGCALSPEDIIITNGCLESVGLALRAVCRPGDTVATESPNYFGFLQVLEGLGLKVLEIATHPRDGMILEALQHALKKHRVRAVLLSTNFSNPLGSCMSDARKRELVEMLGEQEIPLIEDDLYGDLSYEEPRPKVAKAFDTSGQVILCSSFSKTLAPGYRIGWVAPGRYCEAVAKLKTETNLATATLPQWAIADFLAEGGYEHHLRRIRRRYAAQTGWLAEAIAKYFPPRTRVTRPTGGFVLWVELPPGCDSIALYDGAVHAGATIAPGILFSTGAEYRHCLRLNSAYATPEIEPLIARLGRLVELQIDAVA